MRTTQWKYVEYAGTGERELHDEVNDPFELQSLSADPARQPLMQALHDWLVELSAPTAP